MARGSATFELDLDAVADQIATLKPRMIVIGGSNVLFPYPVRELRRLADQVGALVVYDAAHIGLLISSGDFQRPLQEGAHIVTLSTHKIMGGPVGGLVLTDEPELARKMIRLTFPGFMQTRDQNKFAALAVALAETTAHGGALARQMVVNAQTLAAALGQQGFAILGRDGSHTRTHQLFLELGDSAKAFEERCQAANILASDCALAGDMALKRRSGARLATHELTRLGMREPEMIEIAGLIARAALKNERPEDVRRDVERLLARFPTLAFTLDSHS
jgi:glycine hydroxymethyltransferase